MYNNEQWSTFGQTMNALLRNNKRCREAVWKALREGPAANGLAEAEWKQAIALVQAIKDTAGFA